MDPVTLLIILAAELVLVTLAPLTRPRSSAPYQANLEAVANRLQMVDILILCATWDGVVTEAEREVIVNGLRQALKARVSNSQVDEALEGWTTQLAATSETREAALRRLSATLDGEERRETFETVVKMLARGGPRSEASGPFRGGSSPHQELVRAVGAALAIAPAVVEAAARTVR